MPHKISHTSWTQLAIPLLLLAVIGCGRRTAVPINWSANVPGVYENSVGALAESIQFRADGTFVHNILQGGIIIHTDSGKWSIAKEGMRIDLFPKELFYEYYDPMSRALSSEPRRFGSYVYWVIFQNDAPALSPSVEYEYVLKKMD